MNDGEKTAIKVQTPLLTAGSCMSAMFGGGRKPADIHLGTESSTRYPQCGGPEATTVPRKVLKLPHSTYLEKVIQHMSFWDEN